MKIKPWHMWEMWIIKTIDFIKNIIFVYLVSSLIAWDLNPSNWWGFGRFLFALAIVIVAFISYED